MTRVEAIERLKSIKSLVDKYDDVVALREAIKALEQEPCKDANANQHNSNALNDGGQHKNALEEDAISRKAAIEKIHWLGLDNDTAIKCNLAIRALPSVNPQEPKTGHWEWEQYYYYPERGNWHCSECKSVVVECVDKNEKGCIPLYKYCPQCGTKMIEPQESEEV